MRGLAEVSPRSLSAGLCEHPEGQHGAQGERAPLGETLCVCGHCTACAIRYLETENARIAHTLRAHRWVETALTRIAEPPLSNVVPFPGYSIRVPS